MRGLLLISGNDEFLGIAIFLLIMAVAIFVWYAIKNKLDKTQKGLDFNIITGRIHVNLKAPYMPPKAFSFYNALQRALPLEFIAFPNVGVDNIMSPAGDIIAFKTIQNKYVDFVIFDKRLMKPVAVIDLIDPVLTAGSIVKQDKTITKSLESIDMPVLVFKVQAEYNEKEVLAKFLDSQDPYTIAALRKARMPKKQ